MDEPVNKSLEVLQKDKLQAEIDLIRARIVKEFTDKPLTRFDKLAGFLKRWNAVILALIAIAGGFWGVFYPMKSYFDERSKSLQYQLNKEMIDAMDSLHSKNTIENEKAILILSYYESNAIPVLLSYLEMTDVTKEDLIKKYYITIKMIYNRRSRGIVDAIAVKIEENFGDLITDKVIDPNKYYALQNLSGLINSLNLSWKDKKTVEKLYKYIIKEYNGKQGSLLNDGAPILLENINIFSKNL